MTEVRQPIARSAALCFKAFCDVRRLRSWSPAIRKATPARVDGQGRGVEVLFEVGATLSYVLLYAYDDAALRVEWRPGLGSRDAVRGWATFRETTPGECEMTYALELPPARQQDEDALVAAREAVAAFARWMESGPR